MVALATVTSVISRASVGSAANAGAAYAKINDISAAAKLVLIRVLRWSNQPQSVRRPTEWLVLFASSMPPPLHPPLRALCWCAKTECIATARKLLATPGISALQAPHLLHISMKGSRRLLAQMRSANRIEECLSLEAKRKTSARIEYLAL